MRRLACLVGPVAALLGCADPFLPQSVVTELRVLAIRAEPPEVRPGEAVLLDALVLDPRGREARHSWYACAPRPLGQPSPCDDTRLLTAPAGLAEAPGLSLLGTSTTARWVLEAELGPGEEAQAVVLLVVEAEGVREVARKEIRVSRAEAPNQNPRLQRILLGGAPFPEDVLPAVRASARLEWVALLEDGAAELYRLRLPDGSSRDAVEDLRWEWRTTFGRFGLGPEPPSPQPVIDRFIDSGVPPPRDASLAEGGGPSSRDEHGVKVTLRFPEDARGAPPLGPDGVITVAVVVRDGRGGTTWAVRRLRVQ